MTDIVWKIVTAGNGGVGKTTFLHRYLTKQFLQDSKLTVGVSFRTLQMTRHEKEISVIFWDLGGQERFRFMLGTYIKGAAAAFVMFDLSRFDTLWDMRAWIDLIRTNTYSSVSIMLIGSKLDLIDPDIRPSINAEAEQFTCEMNLIGYSTISSRSGENVDETMEKMIDYLLWQKNQGEIVI